MNEITKFNQRLTQEWLVPFCLAKGLTHEGFDGRAAATLSENDVRDFMESLDYGLVTHHQDGRFVAPQSKATESIFWECSKKSVPRKITLWLEPIITMGALRKLQRDFGWTKEFLGLQSKTWAFDLVAYNPEDLNLEYLLCEVKKSTKEIDSLIHFMQKHLDSPASIEDTLKGSERNAFRKVMVLRTSSCEVFWALGPNSYDNVFKVLRGKNNSIQLLPADDSALHEPNNSSKLTPSAGRFKSDFRNP